MVKYPVPGIHEVQSEEEDNPFTSSIDNSVRHSGDTRSSTARRRHNTTITEPHPAPFELSDNYVPEDPRLNLDEAWEGDYVAIQEGLNHALGTSNLEPNWKVGQDDDEEIPNFNEYPDTHPSAFDNYSVNSDRGDLTYNIPLITLNQPSRSTQLPHLSVNTEELHSLEAGTYRQPATPISRTHGAQSPSKFSGILTRISDRIAGSHNPPTPAIDKGTPRASVLLDPASKRSSIQTVANDTFGHFGLGLSQSTAESILSVPTISVEAYPSIHAPTPQASSSRVGLSGMAPVSSVASTTFWKTDTAGQFDHLYLYGNTLGFFSPTSKFRVRCHRLMSHPKANSMVLFLIVLQTCLLAYRQWNPEALGGYYYAGNNWADYFLMAINVLYTIELTMKIVAYGLVDDEVMFTELGLDCPQSNFSYAYRRLRSLVRENFLSGFPKIAIRSKKQDPSLNPATLNSKYDRFMPKSDDEASSTRGPPGHKFSHKNTFIKATHLQRKVEEMNLHRAYLRDSWQRLDLISVVSFWISLLLSINRYDAENHMNLFRALSCFRILRLCNLTTGTSIILRACQSAFPQLIDVSIFIACFWFIFGIIGVQSFKSSLTRHCEWTNPEDSTDTYINSDLYCGSYLDVNGKPQPFLNRDGEVSAYVKGFRCPINSVCRSGENPYGGTVSFDNIFQSMQLVFVVMSANTFTDIMYYTMNTDNLGASLFFIFTIFILTVWLMNVFIAVIVASFNIAQMEEAEDKQRRLEGRPPHTLFGLLTFNDDLHSKKVKALVQKRPLLRFYYRFEFLFAVTIAAGIIVQCFRSHEMTDALAHTLYSCELAVTIILGLEIIIRLSLYLPEWKVFFLSRRNSFDMFLAVSTIVIIIKPVQDKLGHAYYWLTVFQLARFYRVVLSLGITSDLWLKITHNIKAIFDLTLFYFILTALTSVIIARYFEDAIPVDEISSVPIAMNTLPNCFIGLYVITSTENWTEIMYGLQEHATSNSQRAFGSIFLVAWFIISNSVILSIFIAVIARTLEVSEEGKRQQQLRQFIEDMTDRLQSVNAQTGMFHRFKKKIFKKKGDDKSIERAVTNLLLSGSAVNEFLDKDMEVEEEQAEQDTEIVRDLPKNPVIRWIRVNTSRVKGTFKNPFYDTKKKNTDFTSFDPALFAKNVIAERNKLISKQDEYLKQNPLFNTVFYMLGPRHRLRRFCQKIVKSSHGERIDGVTPSKTVGDAFSMFMFLATIGIVVTASYLTPLFRKGVIQEHGQWNWTFYIDVVFLFIFSSEFHIKIIADGLLFTPNAYMRSSWNWIDFIALVSLWIEFIAFLRNDGNLSRVVRGLKAVRALRLLTISETAKNNFHYTMISGFGKIISAALISLTLIFPFSIWGLNIFNGRLGYCVDGSSYRVDCINEYQNEVFNWEVMSPNVYVQPLLELNRFSSAFSSLYEIVSLEGWSDLLLNVMQSTGSGTPQQPYATPFNGLFVILFNFIGIVFILTLFVSVIIDNYSRVTGRAYLTKSQIQWYQVKKFLMQVKPSKRMDPGSLKGIRKICYRMTVEKNKIWGNWLNFVLLLHIISLLLETFPEGDLLISLRQGCFMLSSTCFFVNCCMLAIARGYKGFISNKWNIFHFVVSFGAWILSILSYPIGSGTIFININKLFLVAMLTFIFPRSNRLSQLLGFASASLPALLSLIFTWFVVFMVYAIAMNQVFGMTKLGPNTTDNINVRSVPKALILLFRSSFGEGWNYIMDDFTLEAPWCTSDVSIDDSDCGNKQYAYILFMSWNIISMYIFVNLFISLILDSFSYINSGSDYAHLIRREEIRKFKRSWQKYDPEGTGFIRPFDLPKFLHSLDGALSFHFYSGSMSIPELCSRWIKRNNPHDPYDITVNYDAVTEILNSMDIPKIQERRRGYEMFLEEAILNMEMHEEPGISFTKVLLQIPLYTTFETGLCLILLDFLDRRLFSQKLEKRLKTKRCYETIAAYACRWKYVENQRNGARDTNIEFDRHLKRNSYFSNEEYTRKENLSEAMEVEISSTSSSEGESIIKVDETAPLAKSYDEIPTKNDDYIPASPLHSYRTGPESAQFDELQNLYLHILNTDHTPQMSQLSPSRFATSPFEDLSASDQRSNVSLIDLSAIGETLDKSSWGPALREVTRKSTNSRED